MSSLSHEEKFLFDLQGYIVVRNVLTKEDVASANSAIDAHVNDISDREGALRNAPADSKMAAENCRRDLGGMLGWEEGNVFRRLLAHPKLIPYLNAFVGEGYRLDHQPMVICQNTNSEGFSLHGGPLTSSGDINPILQYRCSQSGTFFNTLLAMSVQLSDHNEGDGGFVAIPGSHKLNLAVPDEIAEGTSPAFEGVIRQPVTRAGDVVFFSEATVHGAAAWRAAHERRIALYRFAPPNFGYGRGWTENWGISERAMKALLTNEQRSVLQPPYANRLERECVYVDDDGATVKTRHHVRNAAKKAFDKRCFNTEYF